MINLGRSAFLKNRKKNIKKVVLKVPSKVEYIRKASSKILESLEPHKLEESIIFDIKLCTEEALRNAIVHGNRCDKRKSVKIVYWIEDDRLNIEMEDEGDGFDYKHLPDPTANDNIMKNSGRGVYLINHLMDEVEFNETGNKIRMMKSLMKPRIHPTLY